MPDILTQDEIDSLLSAVRKGEVPANAEADAAPRPRHNRAVFPYDFRRPNRIAREQIRALQMLHDSFARGVGSSLSAYLRTLVEVELTSVEQLTYGEFMLSVAAPAALGIFEMNPLKGGAILDLSLHLLFPMIDRILGGPGRPTAQIRELTEIERALVERFYRKMLTDLQQAWLQIGKFEAQLLNLETNPQFVQLTSPNDIAILVTFDIRMGQVEGLLSVCLPFTMLEPILPKLVTQRWFGARMADDAGRVTPEVERQLRATPLTVRAVLDPIWMPLGEVTHLQPGDILPLGNGAEIPVTLEVEGQPRFAGRVGRRQRKRAVEITAMIDGGGVSHA